MPNMLDYLSWRGDLSFQADPFNEVDNLLLSHLSYVDFEGVLSNEGGVGSLSVRETSERYFSIHTTQEVEERNTFTKLAPFVMKKMAETTRFSDIILCGYVNILSKDRDEQMAAVTCLLPDGTAFVSFRGTDNTIVGWKEDFQLAYLTQTSGQEHAAEYLNRIGRAAQRPLRVGGHSKGGNLAVYASAFCEKEVQDLVREIYCNDGPGFLQNIVDTPGYALAASKTRSFVPEESVFGLLMNGMLKHEVIKSSRKGIYQHDALSWQIMANRFERAEGLSSSSQMVNKTLSEWIDSLREEQRRDFVETVFDILASAGKDTFTEINSDRLKNYGEIARTVVGMEKLRRDSLLDAFAALARTGKDTLLKELQTMFGRLVTPEAPPLPDRHDKAFPDPEQDGTERALPGPEPGKTDEPDDRPQPDRSDMNDSGTEIRSETNEPQN